MTKNQFLYTRKQPKPLKVEGKEQEFDEFQDSFNLDLVIRSIELEDKRRLVLLNDLHERLEKVPQINPKTNKVTGQTKERNTFQSEIYLNIEDSIRFINLYK